MLVCLRTREIAGTNLPTQFYLTSHTPDVSSHLISTRHKSACGRHADCCHEENKGSLWSLTNSWICLCSLCVSVFVCAWVCGRVPPSDLLYSCFLSILSPPPHFCNILFDYCPSFPLFDQKRFETEVQFPKTLSLKSLVAGRLVSWGNSRLCSNRWGVTAQKATCLKGSVKVCMVIMGRLICTSSSSLWLHISTHTRCWRVCGRRKVSIVKCNEHSDTVIAPFLLSFKE